MDGICYYFESVEYNHANAKRNCLTKFGPSNTGGLFEPDSPLLNEAVRAEAVQFSGISSDEALWIGVTSLKDRRTYR